MNGLQGRMKRIWCLILSMSGCVTASNHLIWIPHLPENPGFSAAILVENRLSIDRALAIVAYDKQGEWLGSYQFASSASSRVLFHPREVFDQQPVAYFSVAPAVTVTGDGETASLVGITVAVDMGRANGLGERSLVPAISKPAKVWRIQAGDWQRVFDGVAIVNLAKCLPSGVEARHYDQQGQLLATHELNPPEAPYGKLLLDLGTIFQSIPDSYIEIHSQTTAAVFGLRMSKQLTEGYVLGNVARPLGSFEKEHFQLLQQRQRWRGQGYSSYEVHVTHMCHCIEEQTRETYMLVREGLIKSLLYADTLEPLALIYQGRFQTIDELFQLIETALLAEPHGLQVSYDEAHFFPKEIKIDPNGCTADEEYVIRLDRFAPQRSP